MVELNIKKLAIALLLTVLVGCVVLMISFVEEQSVKRQPTVAVKDTRLGIPAQNKDVIEFFNRYADSDDIIQFRRKNIDLLDSVKTGNPILIFGRGDNPTEIIELAKQKGIKTIGYNLEDVKLTKEELIEQEKKIYELAKQNDLKYHFGPLAIHIVKYGPDLAKNADAIMIQLRNFQLQEYFEEKVAGLIAEMKNSNPEVEIWVELDITPNLPGSPEQQRQLSAKELLDQFEMIKDKADAVTIYYGPNESLVAEEVFRKLRSDSD